MFGNLFNTQSSDNDEDDSRNNHNFIKNNNLNGETLHQHTHQMKSLSVTLKVSLIAESHSLWAHCLWNAGIALSELLEYSLPHLCKGKSVVELGCGAGLPSLASHHLGASEVLLTEYPESSLLDVVKVNISANKSTVSSSSIDVIGLRWGDRQAISKIRASYIKGFDLVILSDLVFNHSQHIPLLATASALLNEENPASTILVAFSHHRPHKMNQDLNFFKLAIAGRSAEEAREDDPFPGLTFRPFKVVQLDSVIMNPMFENDEGDRLIRSQVHIFTLNSI